MNRKLSGSAILGCVLMLGAGFAEAQQAPPPLPPHAAGMMQAGPKGEFPPPFGERMELLGFGGMRQGKVVTGAPFSAIAVSETTQTQQLHAFTERWRKFAFRPGLHHPCGVRRQWRRRLLCFSESRTEHKHAPEDRASRQFAVHSFFSSSLPNEKLFAHFIWQADGLR